MTLLVKRWHPWPMAIVLFFVILVVGNGVVVYLAQSSKVSRIDDHPYERGLAYEEELQAGNRFRQQGWSITTAVVSGSERLLQIALRDRAGAPVPGMRLEGKLLHARDSQQDRVLDIRERAPGDYAAPIDRSEGLWFLDLLLSSNGGTTFRWKEPIKLALFAE